MQFSASAFWFFSYVALHLWGFVMTDKTMCPVSRTYTMVHFKGHDVVDSGPFLSWSMKTRVPIYTFRLREMSLHCQWWAQWASSPLAPVEFLRVLGSQSGVNVWQYTLVG